MVGVSQHLIVTKNDRKAYVRKVRLDSLPLVPRLTSLDRVSYVLYVSEILRNLPAEVELIVVGV